ncbi:MAG TPA: TcfC E-set like domain-containing protein, partial [Pinirhizobacter sp.]|uniref:TcfC E-set like domain-containing protein n=1 Tax=Pinirhizobacter sp. TaxID=2950432 RepID=UPI002C25C64E
LTSKHGWTTAMAAQHQRVAANGASRRVTGTTRLQHAYAERQVKRHFVRGGAFYPDTIGLYQQPLLIGARTQNVFGIMIGSSDTLDDTRGTQSAQPMFVTATRPGLVEIYRNGTLVNTQPVKAGLQPVDTSPLPGGIYAVELRVVEDGSVTSSTNQWVYKPTLWTNTQRRWRYNVFAGRQLRGFSGQSGLRRDGPAYGAAVNMLLHPRFILGLSATAQDDGHAATASFTAQPTEWSMLHANVYRTSKNRARWRHPIQHKHRPREPRPVIRRYLDCYAVQCSLCRRASAELVIRWIVTPQPSHDAESEAYRPQARTRGIL